MAKKQRKQFRLNGFNNLNGEGGEGILSIVSGMFSSFSKRLVREIVGIFFIVIAIVSFLSILGLTLGTWLDFWVSFLQRWFGAGSFLFAIGIAYLGYRIIVPLEEKQDVNVWRKLISFEIAIFSGLGLLDLIGQHAINQASSFGGLVGWGVGMIFQVIIGSFSPLLADILQGVVLSVVFIYGILTGVRKIGKFFLSVEKKLSGQYEGYSTQSIQKSTFGLEDFGEEQRPSTLKRKKRKQTLPPEFRKQFSIPDEQETSAFRQLPRESYLPGLDLLINDQSIKPDERHINQNAGLIEKTLMDFGIPAKVVGFQIGPTVTQFAVEPGYLEKTVGYEGESRQKVKVSQIARLKKDLALALSADRVRIEAPVPGRTYVGIEVPNKNKAIVRLKSILESEEFSRSDSPLNIALGRDVSGKPVVGDLAKMPHLLIAGSTGSGKSVCITSLTVCLVMNNSPEDLKLVMIDPKMVELVRFNGLPHLIGKVETDLERINTVLRWVVIEMQNRYKSFEEIQARDIDSYNRKVKRRKDYEHLPRIVVMIDELADLMMSARDTTEATLVRLAQMARAVGIHLVVATQRPSTDVVTGLIKANFPARIAFSVFSQVDSRVILDTSGAESLLSRGDMLYLAPEVGIPIRAQGILTTDQELESVISYWQEAWQKDEEAEEVAPWENMVHHEKTSSGGDELIGQAINLIRTTGRVSTSLLQRKLKIGYPRAASLMDEMEDMGVVGQSRSGGKEREILINREDDDVDDDL